MQTVDAAPEEYSESNLNCVTVPASAASDKDDSGENVAPDVGDDVSFANVAARVKSIDAKGNLVVEIISVDGQPVVADKPNDEVPAMRSDLESKMQAMDSEES